MMQELFRSDGEKQENIEVEAIRRRLSNAVTNYRQRKELHDQLLEDEKITEEEIKALEAEKKSLTNTLKKLQQQMETKRKMWKEEYEKSLRWEFLAHRETLIRKMEAENQQLRHKNEHLTAELYYLRGKYQKDQKMRSAMQKLKHKLEEIQDVLHSKDEEILKDLGKEQRELQKQLDTRQENGPLAALQFQEESTTSGETQNTDAKDEEHQDKRPLKTEKTKMSWWCNCVKVMWKGVKLGGIILVLVASVCDTLHPVSNLRDVVFALLESCCTPHSVHPVC